MSLRTAGVSCLNCFKSSSDLWKTQIQLGSIGRPPSDVCLCGLQDTCCLCQPGSQCLCQGCSCSSSDIASGLPAASWKAGTCVSSVRCIHCRNVLNIRHAQNFLVRMRHYMLYMVALFPKLHGLSECSADELETLSMT